MVQFMYVQTLTPLCTHTTATTPLHRISLRAHRPGTRSCPRTCQTPWGTQAPPPAAAAACRLPPLPAASLLPAPRRGLCCRQSARRPLLAAGARHRLVGRGARHLGLSGRLEVALQEALQGHGRVHEIGHLYSGGRAISGVMTLDTHPQLRKLLKSPAGAWWSRG